jgi:hypothetical protein
MLSQIASLAYLTKKDVASIVEPLQQPPAAGTPGWLQGKSDQREPRGPQPGLSYVWGNPWFPQIAPSSARSLASASHEPKWAAAAHVGRGGDISGVWR